MTWVEIGEEETDRERLIAIMFELEQKRFDGVRIQRRNNIALPIEAFRYLITIRTRKKRSGFARMKSIEFGARLAGDF